MYFSIIIPVYNAEQYLRQCIDSILDQKYKDIELILVDDGSTDNSKNICEEYKRNDSRIKVIYQANKGSGSARNAGIEIAKGKYCYFPDSDDIMFENALEKMYEETQNYEADIYVFSYIDTYRNKNKTKLFLKDNLYLDSEEVKKQYQDYIKNDKISIQGAPWNKLFKTSIIKNNNIEYPDLRRHQDEVFIARYMDKVTGKVRISDKIIYKYFRNDVKKEWRKFPRNYFDIRTSLSDEFNKLMLKWNPSNKELECYIKAGYINRTQKCFEFSYNPLWKMNSKDRKKYVLECVLNKKVRGAIEFLKKYKKENGEKYKKYIGSLGEIQLKLMDDKKVRQLLIIARIKMWLRRILNK